MFAFVLASAYLIARGYRANVNFHMGTFTKEDHEVRLVNLHLTGLHIFYVDESLNRTTSRRCNDFNTLHTFMDDVEGYNMQKYFDEDDYDADQAVLRRLEDELDNEIASDLASLSFH
jgi:hypothetical protein